MVKHRYLLGGNLSPLVLAIFAHPICLTTELLKINSELREIQSLAYWVPVIVEVIRNPSPDS